MSSVDPSPPVVHRSSSVSPSRALRLTYRVVLRQLLSVGRIVALVALSLTTTVAGFAVGTSNDADIDAAAGVIANLGFAVVIPVVALVFGGGALGDLCDDKTLVYLWLRPMDRWPMVVGAALAALTIAVPVTLPAVVVAAVLTGVGNGIVGATLLAGVVALVAYTAIFTMLGVVLRRFIVWGLAYILIWEGFVALGGAGVAQFAIRKYTRSIIADQTGADLGLADFSTATGVIVPLLVAVAVLAVASWRLARHDID
jgi:ABC-2 type transport system permease protein